MARREDIITLARVFFVFGWGWKTLQYEEDTFFWTAIVATPIVIITWIWLSTQELDHGK
ncbi:MAG: hypothetical protein MN733_27145 [Nitrososphaera sp.]|nr:hypothetical protein [Nitrososphaera sp.]